VRAAKALLVSIGAAACVVAAVLQPAAFAVTGDAVRGERSFQRCFSCHSVDPNERAKLQGPSLYKLLGRPAGAVAGFDYSQAMKAKAATGLMWDAGTLDRYIADPEEVVPGTAMSAAPLRDEQERADIIAYLARSGPYGR
jgi:cytochrome c